MFDNKIKQVIIRNTKHRTLPEVVKLVDAADSKSAVRDDVSVRVRPSGPYLSRYINYYNKMSLKIPSLSEIPIFISPYIP